MMIDIYRAVHRIDYAGELSKNAITGGIDKPSAMPLDGRID